jgi:hypothetical protein
MKWSTIILLPVLFGSVSISCPAFAADESRPASPSPANATSPPGAGKSAGLIAVLDPQTGQLYEPPPAAMREILQAPEFQALLAGSSDRRLSEVRLKDGGYRLDPPRRFLSMLVGVRAPDGRFVLGHPVVLKRPRPEASRPDDGGVAKPAGGRP